jgi:hypothetical protein
MFRAVWHWLGEQYKPLFSLYLLVGIPVSFAAWYFDLADKALLFSVWLIAIFLFLAFSAFPSLAAETRYVLARRKSTHPNVAVYEDFQTAKFLKSNMVEIKRTLVFRAVEKGVTSVDRYMGWYGPLDDITITEHSNCDVEFSQIPTKSGTIVKIKFLGELSCQSKTTVSYTALYDNRHGIIKQYIGSSDPYKSQEKLIMSISVEGLNRIRFCEVTLDKNNMSRPVTSIPIVKDENYHEWPVHKPRSNYSYSLTWEEVS